MFNVLSASDLSDLNLLNNVFQRAKELEKLDQMGKTPQDLVGKVIATVFYEPSTRTRLSFESAALKLGAKIISCENALVSGSSSKGESLEDGVRVISSYADLLIIRHPVKDSIKLAASVSNVPIINAGDGNGEHPTQALLDIYTIYKEFGRLENLTIGVAGDLKNGRTVHSLLQLLSLFQNISVVLISPDELSLPQEYLKMLKNRSITVHFSKSLDENVSEFDVLYMTRIQKERFESVEEYESLKDNFILTNKHAENMKPSSIIMHPLPRVNEIHPDVDANPRARYFQQAQNGLYTRMALLENACRN